MVATPDDPPVTDEVEDRRDTVRLDVDPDGRPALSAVPEPPAARTRPARAPLALAAFATAGWAALTSFLPLPVLAAAALVTGGGGASFGDLSRFGLATWLLCHGVPLHFGTGPVGIAPLVLTVFAAWRLNRAGIHLTRALGGRRRGDPHPAVLAALGVGVAYGLFGAGAAWLASGGGLVVDPVRAGVTLAGFGALAALVGSLRESATGPLLRSWLPEPVLDGARTGTVAALLVAAAGAAAGGVALAVAGDEAADMIGAYHTGFIGQVGMVLLCLAYAPNLALWAVAYLVGPGFLVGRDTVVSVVSVKLGALPAVPTLAALPAGPANGVAALVLGVPLVAALFAGWLLARQRPAATTGWLRLLAAAVFAGPAAGALLALGGAMSGGPLGGGMLDRLGPVWWQVAVFAAATVSVGAGIGAVVGRLYGVARRG
jgi:hypothetical protein